MVGFAVWGKSSRDALDPKWPQDIYTHVYTCTHMYKRIHDLERFDHEIRTFNVAVT